MIHIILKGITTFIPKRILRDFRGKLTPPSEGNIRRQYCRGGRHQFHWKAPKISWEKFCNTLLRLATACIFFYTPLTAETKVELVANFAADADRLSDLLKERGMAISVTRSDLTHYSGIKKDHSWIGKFLRSYSLDFPRTIDTAPDVQKIVFWNIDGVSQRNYNLKKFPREKLVLFMWEPPSVLPKMYKSTFHKAFSRVYTWDDSLVDGKHYFKFFYPILQPMRENLPSFEERALCTLIATNILSKQPNTLYPERKEAIAFFEKNAPDDFALYGRGWDPAEYKTYKGYLERKIETLSQYRFSICYENTASCSGYISEKIFDCFAAGNVPVYWGATNVTDYIPKECFIDKRDFKTLDDLYAYLKNMSKEEFAIYLDNIREFLASDRAQLFSQKHFDDTFCEAVTAEY
jgi:hypothetical protein